MRTATLGVIQHPVRYLSLSGFHLSRADTDSQEPTEICERRPFRRRTPSYVTKTNVPTVQGISFSKRNSSSCGESFAEKDKPRSFLLSTSRSKTPAICLM